MGVKSEHIHLTGCIGNSGLGFDLVLAASEVSEVRTEQQGCDHIPREGTILTDFFFLGSALRRLLETLVQIPDLSTASEGLLAAMDHTLSKVADLKGRGVILQFTLNPEIECNSGDAICFKDKQTGEWICID